MLARSARRGSTSRSEVLLPPPSTPRSSSRAGPAALSAGAPNPGVEKEKKNTLKTVKRRAGGQRCLPGLSPAPSQLPPSPSPPRAPNGRLAPPTAPNGRRVPGAGPASPLTTAGRGWAPRCPHLSAAARRRRLLLCLVAAPALAVAPAPCCCRRRCCCCPPSAAAAAASPRRLGSARRHDVTAASKQAARPPRTGSCPPASPPFYCPRRPISAPRRASRGRGRRRGLRFPACPARLRRARGCRGAAGGAGRCSRGGCGGGAAGPARTARRGEEEGGVASKGGARSPGALWGPGGAVGEIKTALPKSLRPRILCPYTPHLSNCWLQDYK